MNNKSKSGKLLKSRRTFLQSLGMLVTGLGLTRPSVFSAGRFIMKGEQNLDPVIFPGTTNLGDVQLPQGVSAVWDLLKAYHDTTLTRERICINGLWLWQPEETRTEKPPLSNWGYFKVPGPWPRVSDFSQKDSQSIFPHPAWKDVSPEKINRAWYQREIQIPTNWKNRRITIYTEYLYSSAEVFIDGIKAGDMLFPSAELDISHLCRPGEKHNLNLQVVALPLQQVLLSFTDSNAASQVIGSVARRGLCGEVFLVSAPQKTFISNLKIITSVRKEEITVKTSLENVQPGSKYVLQATITDKGTKVKEFKSKPFNGNDLNNGTINITEKWLPEKLWDTITPENQYQLELSLMDRENKLLDTAYPVSFGFREFWIDGRDFYLNGTRIFLSALPIDNAQMGTALATYERAKETMLRLQSIGVNFVFTHNYGCQPGTHLSFTELLKAADDIGMLVSFSQPHFSHYNWKNPDADENNGYARHAAFYVRMAQNHPSIIFYSTSHNSTGYAEDMNPDLIDGLVNRDQWGGNNVKLAMRAEAILNRLDPEMIVYHHSSGNLGSMHTSNFYTNWAPVQEKCDWLEHWSTKGVKPFFTCEYSDPSSWDWTMYRGWYKGERAFGGAKVPWEFCVAEWNSQTLGDSAFQITEEEKKNLRWEAEQFRTGKIWSRFAYPYHLDYKLPERYPVYAIGIADSWRAYRTWEMSANSQWEYSNFWRLRKGVKTGTKELKVDWENLQRPGISPDRIEESDSHMEHYFERTDWVPSVASEAFVRNNLPLLAYIGGKSEKFTSKDHNFLPGESFEKQIILINNCRQTITCECQWSINLPQLVNGSSTATIATGQQKRIPVHFDLPATLSPGSFEIKLTAKFSNGEVQTDTFIINILTKINASLPVPKIALWDPRGDTAKLIRDLGLNFQEMNAGSDLAGFDLLIVGRSALSLDGPGLDLSAVRNGLKVIIFEQSSEVLEKRFGFRIQEYGLRNVFIRVPDHPLLAGLKEDNLHDWRGEATILPPRLKYELSRHFGTPAVDWCGIPVTKQWRCGNQGTIASVLIEKPACGNFLPVIDGGFSLQYSPLMEYREEKGMVLFCQMDVTARSEFDPAAAILTRNIISYMSAWKPAPVREALYIGEEAGLTHLKKAGIHVNTYSGGKLKADQVLILGPGEKQKLKANVKVINKWLKDGGHLLSVGLDQAEINPLLPGIVMKQGEHIAAYFKSFGLTSPLTGIGPADVHNRAPKTLPLVNAGAAITGNGILAIADNTNALLCQLVPWQLDYSHEQHNVKQTYRHTSFLFNRLLGNLGLMGSTKILARFNSPVKNGNEEKRWLDDLYLDQPEEWDDPYRFFRW